MEQLAIWWRARSGRERRLMQGAAILVLGVLLPAWAYLSAVSFRAEAAARLANARQIETQVARIAEASQTQSAGDSEADVSLRGRVLASAQAAGLTAARLEAASADRVRVSFEPASSLAVYRWIDSVSRSGAFVGRTTIVRVGDSELVEAEFAVTGSP